MSRYNIIKPEYNNILFQIKSTPGDRRVIKSSGGFYTRPIPEGYYMNRFASKKSNPIIGYIVKKIFAIRNFFKSI